MCNVNDSEYQSSDCIPRCCICLSSYLLVPIPQNITMGIRKPPRGFFYKMGVSSSAGKPQARVTRSVSRFRSLGVRCLIIYLNPGTTSPMGQFHDAMDHNPRAAHRGQTGPSNISHRTSSVRERLERKCHPSSANSNFKIAISRK